MHKNVTRTQSFSLAELSLIKLQQLSFFWLAAADDDKDVSRQQLCTGDHAAAAAVQTSFA